MPNKSYNIKPLFISLGLFLLALLVRLPYLDNYLTIDEVKWVEGAGQFLLGLRNGDLMQTYWHFHPGITITWGESLILWFQYLASDSPDLATFVAAQIEKLTDIVGLMRLSGVIITSLSVVGIYWLARPLLGNWAALLGAGLLAADPFFVAHSRIVNGDAGSAALMMMAFLAFAQLWQTQKWSIVILAGVLAGLAILTKLPAPIILPWMAVPAILGYLKDKNRRFWLNALLMYGVVAALTFVLLFPAMWVRPLEMLRLIYVDAFNIGEIGGGHATFFLGQINNNPGWLFYPYVIAFRLTPITVAGLLVIPFWLWRHRDSVVAPRTMLVGALLAYIIFVYLVANVSPKKLDRYVMAVIPALLLLASVGLDWMIAGIANFFVRREQLQRLALTPLIVLAFIAVQAFFVIANYPYVLTYYNPLLGGYANAVRQVPVGWGEGMEQAAAWINTRPNASQLLVSSWYSDIVRPYLHTQTTSFSSNGQGQLEADYVIFYVNQYQRQKPNNAIINYFIQKKPVFQVEYQGTPYVWVYQAPRMQPISGRRAKIEGRAQLLGLSWQPAAPRRGGDTVDLTLFVSTLGDLPNNETFDVALAAPDGTLWGNWQPTGSDDWRPNTIVEWRGVLALPPDIPPGEYRLAIRLMDTNISSEVTRFPLDKPVIALE